MAEAENELNELGTGIRDAVMSILDENRAVIDAFSLKLHPMARILLSGSREKLSGKVMELTSRSREIMSGNSLMTSGLSMRLSASAKKSVSDRMMSLDGRKQKLQASAKNMMAFTIARMTSLENSLNNLNPDNVLRRGYTITSINGRIMKSSGQAFPNDMIDTRFSDGTLRSRVTGKAETGNAETNEQV
jgi:exodeoxyribonuclease VII large subunit